MFLSCFYHISQMFAVFTELRCPANIHKPLTKPAVLAHQVTSTLHIEALSDLSDVQQIAKVSQKLQNKKMLTKYLEGKNIKTVCFNICVLLMYS